mmetsp:Transcript_30456/g.60241  ORF Transcript_30456/g.60241 Transcript_30456/m.60241 type:complete len:156 (-) Transcript_30456:43-510(-)
MADECVNGRHGRYAGECGAWGAVEEEEVAYKLGWTLVVTGRYIEATVVLHDWKEREVDGRAWEGLRWAGSPHLAVLYSDLMFWLGYECMRWREKGKKTSRTRSLGMRSQRTRAICGRESPGRARNLLHCGGQAAAAVLGELPLREGAQEGRRGGG